MSYKVVLIEDNQNTVRSLLSTIPWEKLDCVMAGTAADGESGRKLLLAERPDIVLTDIRMPNKSGLEMLEEVKDEMPDLISIILTGYDQFQYASKAIKLRAFDYILKPVRNNEVEAALLRAVEMLDRKKQTADATAEVSRLRTKAKLLSLLTNMSHEGQEIHQLRQESGLDCAAFYLMIFQMEEAESIPQSIVNGTDDLLRASGVKAVSVILYDSLVLYVMRPDLSGEWRYEAEDICDVLRQHIPVRMNIGISSLTASKHMVRQTYQQARQALYESAMDRASDDGVFYREGASGTHGKLADMRNQVEALAEQAELTDECAAHSAEELIRLSGLQYSQLRALVSLYAMLLSKKYAESNAGAVDKAMSTVWFVTSEEQVEKCLLEINEALRSGMKAEEKQCSLLTKNVLDYIRIHGAERLSLNAVADKFHVSANYLSALVRKETGITFHDHIINVKMEIARSMLADPRILVEEVAYAVGYRNYVSFYNVFKQNEQMTPTEYRNMLANK